MSRCAVLTSLLLVAGCYEGVQMGSQDGPSDAGPSDAGSPDAGASDAGSSNAGIRIISNTYANDESGGNGSNGHGCVISNTPMPPSKSSGLLEIDPYLNPNAGYTLELLVENDLPTLGLDDFAVEKATLTYVDTAGNLTGPPSDVALLSGTVRAGGAANAAIFTLTAVSLNEVLPWIDSFSTSSKLGTSGGATESLVVQVQLDGVLGSGASASSSILDYPLSVCFGCNNLPLVDGGPSTGDSAVPECTAGKTPIATGHGPCCAPQDFYVTCTDCGQPGGPCCGGINGSCVSGACVGSPPTGTEFCPMVPSSLQLALTCPDE